MEDIHRTIDVLSEDRSTVRSEAQPENMEDISVTAEVSRPDKSIDSANGRFANNCEADPEILTPGSTWTERMSREN